MTDREVILLNKPMTQSQKFSRSPIAIAIVALWILNDLVLKQAFGNFWTGKISDITGLVAFPFFVCLILAKIFKSTKELKLFTISVLLVHSVFALINIRQDWNDFFHKILFSNHHGTADLEDLFCIPITLPILYFLFFKMERLIIIILPKILFPILSIFAFVATSQTLPVMYIREIRTIYPNNQEVKTKEVQTFIWYTNECSYDKFNIYFFEENFTLEFRKVNFRKFVDERLNIPPLSKNKFENRKEFWKSPIKIELKQKDFYSVMDARYQKMRFELDLKLNLEPKNYVWCIESEEILKTEGSYDISACIKDHIVRDSYDYEYKQLNAHCGKIKIR